MLHVLQLILSSVAAFQLGRAEPHSVNSDYNPAVLMSGSLQEQPACQGCAMPRSFSQYCK